MNKALSILRLAEAQHERNRQQKELHKDHPKVIDNRSYDQQGHEDIKKAIKILENYEDNETSLDDHDFGIPGV